MLSDGDIKKQICEMGKRIYDKGMVAANDGNISFKISDNEFLCTPTGVSKGFMTPDYICRIDGEGNILHANGSFKPSSEIKMHLRVYAMRPDIKAVVHAHPLYATGFAIAGIPLDKPIISEAVLSLGTVPIAPYGTPSTSEIPDAITPFLQKHEAILLANHGALTYADSLIEAYLKMESVEFYAQLLFIAEQLGGAKEIPAEKIEKLYEIKGQYKMPDEIKEC